MAWCGLNTYKGGTAGANASTGDGKKFYGIDLQAGAKLILGIELNFKIGIRF
jgi:hypothetical protein